MLKNKYTFPAIFFQDGDGVGVKFPDLEGCVTCADDYAEAVQYAQEALGGWILSQEDMSAEIPASSPLEKIYTELGDIVVLVSVYPKLLREAEKREYRPPVTLRTEALDVQYSYY